MSDELRDQGGKTQLGRYVEATEAAPSTWEQRFVGYLKYEIVQHENTMDYESERDRGYMEALEKALDLAMFGPTLPEKW